MCLLHPLTFTSSLFAQLILYLNSPYFMAVSLLFHVFSLLCVCAALLFFFLYIFFEHSSSLTMSIVLYQYVVVSWPLSLCFLMPPVLPLYQAPLSFALSSNESNHFWVTPQRSHLCVWVYVWTPHLVTAHTDVIQTWYICWPLARNRGG